MPPTDRESEPPPTHPEDTQITHLAFATQSDHTSPTKPGAPRCRAGGGGARATAAPRAGAAAPSVHGRRSRRAAGACARAAHRARRAPRRRQVRVPKQHDLNSPCWSYCGLVCRLLLAESPRVSSEPPWDGVCVAAAAPARRRVSRAGRSRARATSRGAARGRMHATARQRPQEELRAGNRRVLVPPAPCLMPHASCIMRHASGLVYGPRHASCPRASCHHAGGGGGAEAEEPQLAAALCSPAQLAAGPHAAALAAWARGEPPAAEYSDAKGANRKPLRFGTARQRNGP